MNGCHVTFVCDDEKVTSDTSDNSNNHDSDKDIVNPKKESDNKKQNTFVDDEEESDTCQVSLKKKRRISKTVKNTNKSCLLSRFVPEFIDKNKITMV